MNKDRYDDLAWFDQLESNARNELAKTRLAARKARQATQVAPTLIQRLLAPFKRFLAALK